MFCMEITVKNVKPRGYNANFCYSHQRNLVYRFLHCLLMGIFRHQWNNNFPIFELDGLFIDDAAKSYTQSLCKIKALND